MSPTNWTWRTPITTTWDKIRLWWAYLQDNNWDYILDSNSERIITIVVWWDLPINTWLWITRPWPSSWTWRPTI